MKLLSLVSIVLLFVSPATGQQTIHKSMATQGVQEIFIKGTFADQITITESMSAEITVDATYNINEGKDNDKFKLELRREGKTLVCEAEVDDNSMKKDGDHCNLNIDLNLEISIPTGLELEVSTISGDVNIVSSDRVMELNTISGDLDIRIPVGTKADLECHSISGRVFADPAFNIELETDEGAFVLPFANVEGQINNGGNKLEFNTISGNIYLRKK